MEPRIIRKDVKKCQVIYPHADYYLFSGARFQSCSKQGGPLVTYPEVKTCLHGIAILPDGKLLVDDAKSVFHLLDLNEGKVLASQKMTKNRICQSRFAISGDGKTAFRIWSWGKSWYLVKINLLDLSYCTYKYKASMYGISDIIYKSHNELLVLEVQNISIGDRAVSQNQVTSVTICGEECITTPLYQWQGDRCGKFFDGRFVWESGYVIRDLCTNECFSLLEQSDILLPKNHVALSHIYYPEKKYLQLINAEQNIFIDCENRKIIARYYNDPQKLIYCGICIGDEFWIGKADGIYATPFPVIEG